MTEPRPRGRPRKYDPDTALENVLDAFWESGFSATSLDRLAEATGMNRPSLYAAFGDKKQAYLRALVSFQADMERRFGAQLAAKKPIRQALLGYFRSAIDLYTQQGASPRGCFAICTAPVEAPGDPEIRAALGDALEGIDGAIATRLRQAKAAGELPASCRPVALARLLAATLHSLAVRARAGEAREQLERMALDAVRALVP